MRRIVVIASHRAVSAAILIGIGAGIGAAQSVSSANPTPLTAAYSGKGTGTDTDYFFSATRGPGEVSVSLKLSAKQYSTFGRLEVTDASGNMLATLNMDAASSTGAAQQTRTFTLAKKATIRLKLSLDSNLDEYTLSFGGGNIGGLGTNPNGRVASSQPRPAATAQTSSSGTTAPSLSNPNPLGRVASPTAQQNLISVRCPNSVNVGIRDVPAGWTDWAARKVAVSGISASGRQVTCEYKDSYYDAALVQTAPEGFDCTVPNIGPKTADCRRKIVIKSNE
jgi:hypothetical protein